MSLEVVIVSAGIGVAILMVTSITTISYRKCPPNQAMIISGMSASEGGLPYRIVVGGGAVVLPLLQQANFLSLEPLTIKLPDAAWMRTADSKYVSLKCSALIKVRPDNISIATAAENFLGKSNEEMSRIATEIIEGHLHATVAGMTTAEIGQSISLLSQRVQEWSIADLAKLGLTVVTLTLKDFDVMQGDKMNAATDVEGCADTDLDTVSKSARLQL